MHRRSSPSRTSRTLGYGGLVATVLLSAVPWASGAASDPFAAALPSSDTRAPEGRASEGSEQVGQQHGSASYAIPIVVPPGRNAMQPSLALTYSSNAPLRGGVAVGWSLDLPTIEREPGHRHAVVYRLSLGGRSERLVEIPESGGTGSKNYRPEHDDAFARVKRIGASTWMVDTPDGLTRWFEAGGSDGVTWRLTRETDRFGNTVTYAWQDLQFSDMRTHRLHRIEYTSNPDAGLQAHARVELGYTVDYCTNGQVPIGAQADFHFGQKRLHGAYRLTSIRTRVRPPGGSWRNARSMALGYDAASLSCDRQTPALRYLERIDVTAYAPDGTATTAPPIRFTYAKTRTFDEIIHVGEPVVVDGGGASLVSLPNPLDQARWGEYGTEKGPEAALMDMDGDGIADQVRVTKPGPGQERCQLGWRRGRFGGGFDSEETWFDLPSLAWNGDGPDIRDSCTLNGQLVRYPTQHTIDDRCLEHIAHVGYVFVDWDQDGDMDLLTSVNAVGDARGCSEDFACWLGAPVESEPGSGAACDGGGTHVETSYSDGQTWHICQCDGGQVFDGRFGMCRDTCSAGQDWQPGGGCAPTCDSFESCLDDPGTGGDGLPPLPGTCHRSDLSVRGPWRLFTNDGDGFYYPHGAPRAVDISAPLALPISAGELAPPTAGPAGLPTLVDIDGDGYQDLVELMGPGNTDTASLAEAVALKVWRGNGTPTFPSKWETWPIAKTEVENSAHLPSLGYYPQGNWLETVGSPNVLTSRTGAELTDLNGDGLPDIVFAAFPKDSNKEGLFVLYNLEGRFDRPRALHLAGAVSRSRVEMPAGWTLPAPLQAGWRASERRWVDLDGDGLPEMIETPPASSVSQKAAYRRVFRVHGDAHSQTAIDLDLRFEALERLTRATSSKAWFRASDFVDVTGDGMPDLVTWDAAGNATIRTDRQPLYLLTQVDNGRGAVTSFEYARATDPERVATEPSVRNRPRWVVSRMVVSPGQGQPDMITSYRYADPRTGITSKTYEVPPTFLGYGEVTIERSGQGGDAVRRTVIHYDYDVSGPQGSDRRGHAVREDVYLAVGADAWVPVETTEREYAVRELFGGKALFTHLKREVRRLYGDAAGIADSVTVRTELWSPHSTGSGTTIYLHTRTTEGLDEDGNRERRSTVRAYEAAVSGSWLVLLEDERIEDAIGAVVARTNTTYDFFLLPVHTDVYIDATTYARTTRTFDIQTGNVLTVRRPSQQPSGPVTTYGYDASKTYVTTTVNELGHRSVELRDPATGALTSRYGPNRREKQQCVYLFFPSCTTITADEAEHFRIDGFGRVREHQVSVEPATGSINLYDLRTIEWRNYVDHTVPNLQRVEQLIDWDGPDRVVTETTYDGAGRVIQTRALGGDGGPAHTDYDYDAGGQVAVTRVPDPSSPGNQAIYAFERDGLGRVTAVYRPDGSVARTTHLGPRVTSSLYHPVDGVGAATSVDRDGYGRIARIIEHESTGGADAITTYGYDAADRMDRVEDADGIVTTMTHDRRGKRTAVWRGQRVWRYRYDADGSITHATTPHDPWQLEANHTSVTTYDALGRVLTFTPGRRDMSAARAAQLGAGTVTYAYDTAANGVGRLASVSHGSLWTIDYQYDVRGRAAREERRFQLGYRVSLARTQWVERTYNALGAAVDVRWDDGTTWTYDHNDRGQVSAVTWRDKYGTSHLLAHYERLPSGQPHTRMSGFDQTRTWQYDALGRVEHDRVFFEGQTGSLAQRTYGYDGHGELRAVTGEIKGMTADMTFDYDRRGRLATAHDETGYQAAVTYSPGGNVHTAAIASVLEMADRSVDYLYAGNDPQAVTALSDSLTGESVLELDYDVAGNVVRRRVRDGGTTRTFQYEWDGADQLREATGPGGTVTYYYHGPERLVAIGDGGVRLYFGERETHVSTAGKTLRTWHHVAAGEPIARIENNSAVELQYADAMQNLMLSVSDSGSSEAVFRYGAFGELISALGGETHRRQFNGKESDLETGLRFYGYRHYDPIALRWTGADPLYRFAPDFAGTEPQRANLYAFSLNNPVRYYDPDGRDATTDPEVEPDRASWVLSKKRRQTPERSDRPLNTKVEVAEVNEFGGNIGPQVKIVLDRSDVLGGQLDFMVLTFGSDGISLTAADWSRDAPLGTKAGVELLDVTAGAGGLDVTIGAVKASKEISVLDNDINIEAKVGLAIDEGRPFPVSVSVEASSNSLGGAIVNQIMNPINPLGVVGRLAVAHATEVHIIQVPINAAISR